MINHITLRVKDIGEAKIFYTAVLSPIGYKSSVDQEFDAVRVLGFERDGKTDTWFTTDTPTSGPCHIAWRAEARDDVEAFYRAALSAGAVDNGAPGLREHYHSNYYSAFVHDPNGHNIEVVCHSPSPK